MRVNADFGTPVSVQFGKTDWIPSPMAGVERKMLDRIGGEVARATSIVRYEAGSHFSEHTHSGGEEFIVLEGTFQDEHADYPAGTYVRNPIGTHHIPRSDEGCTIFVKLWQFDESDDDQFALDLDSVALDPINEKKGISRAVVFQNKRETVSVERWSASENRTISDAGGTEVLLLEGAIEWDGAQFTRHDWIRIPPGHEARFRAGKDGTRIWMKTGHLVHIKLPEA